MNQRAVIRGMMMFVKRAASLYSGFGNQRFSLKNNPFSGRGGINNIFGPQNPFMVPKTPLNTATAKMPQSPQVKPIVGNPKKMMQPITADAETNYQENRDE